jgi:hypothetical protein
MDNPNVVIPDSIIDSVRIARDDNAAELRRSIGLNPYIREIAQQFYGTQNSELYRSRGAGIMLVNIGVN